MIIYRIKERLDEVGMTAYRLAIKIGVSHGTVSKYVNERTSGITSDMLDKFCWALECTPGDLIKYVKTRDD